MSQSRHDAFVHARLAVWQRRITETATVLAPPQTGSVPSALLPVLDQLVGVYNLSTGLVADLRQSADSSLTQTDTGCAYLTQLSAALAHTNRAATHLSTALAGLADLHRPTPRPGTTTPAESRLNHTLGRAAARRSLQRALDAVTRPGADAQPASASAPLPVIGEQHRRASGDSGTQHGRRHS